ncbi:MAG: AEC family transporter [Ruminococcus sp.]|nr:AEC family transporter [Ruminococcus sp.]
MVQNLIIVSEQVAILFILIALGFACGKVKMLNDTSASHLTNLVLYFATPCIMIQSFQDVKYDPGLVLNLAVTALCAVLIMTGSIVFSRLVFRSKNESRRVVLRFAAVFSNCGFMSLPLQRAVLGSKGVFYGAVFVAVFNVIVWSYGLIDMSGGKKSFSIRKLILNPGVLGAVTATVLFLTRVSLPNIVLSPISYIAALNTPIPMIVIGYHLSKAKLSSHFKDKALYAVMGVRLFLIPAAALFIMKLCQVDSDVLISCTVAASAPVAAMTTMFSTKFGRDTQLSVGLVSISTLVSIITMPVIIALAQTIC